jgi:hypothetical protein
MSFEKWIPIDNLVEPLYLEAVHDDHEGFRLLLKGSSDQDKVLRITFDPALSYRNTDEGDLLKTINGQDFGGWSLYIVSNSGYLKWFSEESHGIHEDEDIIHYAIYTPNDCLDVLSAYPPKVEWLN